MLDRSARPRGATVLLAAAVTVLVAGVAAVVVVEGDAPVAAVAGAVAPSTEAPADATTSSAAAAVVPVEPTTTAAPPAPTTAPPPPPTTAPPPPNSLPPAAALDAPAPGQRFTMDPYRGLGAWIDVFDWSWTFTGGRPGVGPADVDRMAGFGVRTLYIQTSRHDHPADVVDWDLLEPIIDRAHQLGMKVVGWYLPTLVDPAADLRRTLAMAALPVDGIGIDIEARHVTDVAERNRRLVAYAASVRAALPGEVLSGIVLPPVVMEDVNPNYWPGFPWRELAPSFDVWQTMSYWTQRRSESGWRDGYLYTVANIDRVRANLGWADAPVHPIGGIGDQTTPEQIAGMVQGAVERGALGGSIYDYRTTHDALWSALAAFNP